MFRSGKKFNITFIDDFSRYARLYILNSKDEQVDILQCLKQKWRINLTKRSID